MARPRDPIEPYRPGRPMWVYIAGALLLVVVLAAVMFTVAYRSEAPVDPRKAEPPIVTPRSAPTDGEASDSPGVRVNAPTP